MKIWHFAFILIAFTLHGVHTSTDITQTEEGILILNAENFEKAVKENDYLLVEFYVPWCEHCKSFAPEYIKIAKQLQETGSLIKLAQVNATGEAKLAEDHAVAGYPTFIFYRQGVPIDYNGDRKVADILAWLSKKIGPAVRELDSVEAAEKFLQENEIAIVGFFRKKESSNAKTFSHVGHEMDTFVFGIATNEEIFPKYGVKDGAIVLFKPFDDKKSVFKGKVTVENLKKFIQIESLPLIIDFNAETSARIFGGFIKSHLLFFVAKLSDHIEKYVDPLRDLAQQYRNEILFVTVSAEAQDHSRIFEFFGLSKDDVPTMRLVNLEDDMLKYKPASDDFSPKKVKDFLKKFTDGKLKPHLLEQTLPEDWDAKPVKILVASNFFDVALDPTKNVLVEFHAPWCGHCKQLTPVYEKLAEKYKDHEDVVIAKIDATANEFEKLKIPSFPTIKLFRKGDNHVFDFTGERNLENFVGFIESGGKSEEAYLEDPKPSAKPNTETNQEQQENQEELKAKIKEEPESLPSDEEIKQATDQVQPQEPFSETDGDLNSNEIKEEL